MSVDPRELLETVKHRLVDFHKLSASLAQIRRRDPAKADQEMNEQFFKHIKGILEAREFVLTEKIKKKRLLAARGR